MRPLILLLALVCPLMMSCTSERPYKAAHGFEGVEYVNARLDVYPNDVREHLDQYTNTIVAWVGVITSTDAQDTDDRGASRAITTFQHHYFDWQQQGPHNHQQYILSPRGEGSFRVEWTAKPKVPSLTSTQIESFAAPGKMAIVYGTPQKVDGGVVVLKYRFMRVISSPRSFSTGQFDYGRTGEPITYIGR